MRNVAFEGVERDSCISSIDGIDEVCDAEAVFKLGENRCEDWWGDVEWDRVVFANSIARTNGMRCC